MQIPRIYQNITIEHSVTLSPEAIRHVVNVLRLTTGAPIILFNGDNHEYFGELEIRDKRTALVHINNKIPHSRESPLKIHLAQGIARGEKMDFIIQKAVELGVHEITPLFTERCNVKLDASRIIKRIEHWQMVAISAAEQCGRNQITKIHAPSEIAQFVATTLSEQKFILSHRAEQDLKSIAKTTSCTLLVGPEGGFAPHELKMAEAQEFIPIVLGPRILRTETAALVAVSLLQSQLGDL
ncbi:MAG: 16S rRNA (uracil(1498)-N(3))-methyltransferase [Gammaproteobacteria bacterium]|jgi:16S rRNA (uracil1498-N3)-methyltransferase